MNIKFMILLVLRVDSLCRACSW